MTALAPDSRPARYLANLDVRLATQCSAVQLLILDVQLKLWTRAYEGFVNAIDVGQLDPSPAGPDLDDYLVVIAEIQTRQGRLR